MGPNLQGPDVRDGERRRARGASGPAEAGPFTPQAFLEEPGFTRALLVEELFLLIFFPLFLNFSGIFIFFYGRFSFTPVIIFLPSGIRINPKKKKSM